MARDKRSGATLHTSSSSAFPCICQLDDTLLRNSLLQYTYKTCIMGDDAPQDTPQQDWWEAFPEPKAECTRTDPAIVSKLIEVNAALGKNAKRDFLLVDVRRTDWEGGTISTSINLPAHTFYQTRSQVYQLVKQAGIKRIIFYCGSSNGRGPRCARWMQDYLDEVGETDIKAEILTGGIKGWQKAYDGQLMDFYDEKAWEKKE